MKKIVMLLVGASLLYLSGAITVQYKLFPYNLVLKLKNKNDLRPDYLKNMKYEKQTSLYNIYEIKKAEIVMLGDSITFGVNWNELLDNNNIINRGIGSDTTEGFIQRLDYIYKLKPKYVFIMGGINDIGKGYGIDIIFNNYKLIIENLKNRNITPIVQSTLFTRDLKYNAKVKKLNNLLINYCKINKVDFVNLNERLSKNNLLIKNYTYDGVHLKANGYEIWKNILLNYLNKLVIQDQVQQDTATKICFPSRENFILPKNFDIMMKFKTLKDRKHIFVFDRYLNNSRAFQKSKKI